MLDSLVIDLEPYLHQVRSPRLIREGGCGDTGGQGGGWRVVGWRWWWWVVGGGWWVEVEGWVWVEGYTRAHACGRRAHEWMLARLQLMPALLTCIVGKRLCDSPLEDHWGLRHHVRTLESCA